MQDSSFNVSVLILILLAFSLAACEADTGPQKRWPIKWKSPIPIDHSSLRSSAFKDFEVFFYIATAYDKDGNENSWYYKGSGSDGKWFTSDDVMNSYYVDFYDGEGNVIVDVTYDDVGSDGKWLTKDDTIFSYNAFVPAYKKQLFRDSGYGMRHIKKSGYDKQLFKDSDYDKSARFDDLGPDGIWFTSDDKVDWAFSTKLLQGEREERHEWLEAGKDGIWLTEDDTIRIYDSRIIDERGNIISDTQYNKPGNDGKWITTDDKYSHYEKYVLNAEGNIIGSFMCYKPGHDGIWLTDDDKCTSYTGYIQNSQGIVTREIRFSSPGKDDVWWTEDDDISSYYDTVYNDSGNRIRVNSYDGEGEDGIWFTGDDIREYGDCAAYAYDDNDRLTLLVGYKCPNPSRSR